MSITGREPLNVFITTDTEVWPRIPDWRSNQLAEDIRRDIYGETADGTFGIKYQMDVMDACGLQGVFFVESLFASAVGAEPLGDIVRAICSRGHDAQLHIHPEWLKWIEPGRPTHENIGSFSADEQMCLLKQACVNFTDAANRSVQAFRAGNYGADFRTLAALSTLGITFDSSYNPYYLATACQLNTGSLESQPRRINGIWEYPVSSFFDRPGHLRHVQICACSYSEMKRALECAWRLGWDSFVIVSHSFELIKDRKSSKMRARPDRIVIDRFEKLCRLLGQNNDRFVTRTFSQLPTPVADAPPKPHITGRIWHTAERVVEQGFKRML